MYVFLNPSELLPGTLYLMVRNQQSVVLCAGGLPNPPNMVHGHQPESLYTWKLSAASMMGRVVQYRAHQDLRQNRLNLNVVARD